MDPQPRNKHTIIILSAVLLAALVVGVVVYFLLPSKSVTTPLAPNTPETSSFDFSTLQKPEYLRLDTRSIQEGALPVAPPVGAGRANPFL